MFSMLVEYKACNMIRENMVGECCGQSKLTCKWIWFSVQVQKFEIWGYSWQEATCLVYFTYPLTHHQNSRPVICKMFLQNRESRQVNPFVSHKPKLPGILDLLKSSFTSFRRCRLLHLHNIHLTNIRETCLRQHMNFYSAIPWTNVSIK